TFKLITENASRLRKMEDQSTYPLEAAKYRLWEERQKKESERFENIFKPIDDFVVENLAADLPQIQSDTSRIARNEDWIKDRRKDIQLYETLRIMQDMIRMDALAGKR
ncbi:MAG TPA: carboxy terminal-processing peptidase, partial [Saprospiraceae bacterium]|nr:carboxy terminal-processing peptidase [Saprospiraceae bacterium]